MQHVSFEDGKQLCLTHTCAQCDGILVMPWDSAANSYAVRCGKDSTHEGFTRVPTLTEARRRGEQLPLEVEQQFQRKEHREMQLEEPEEWRAQRMEGRKEKDKMLDHIERTDQALRALVPKSDAGNSKMLESVQLKLLIDYAEELGLNPYLKHVDIYFGQPRVTIYGRYYHAARQPNYGYVRSRPLTFNERQDQRIEEHVHAWLAEVIGKNGSIIGAGFGYSQDKEEGQLMKGVSEEWATPQRRAEKRAEEDALGKAYPIGIGVVEEGGTTDDAP